MMYYSAFGFFVVYARHVIGLHVLCAVFSAADEESGSGFYLSVEFIQAWLSRNWEHVFVGLHKSPFFQHSVM